MAARERKHIRTFTVYCADNGEELVVRQYVDYIIVCGADGDTRLEGPTEYLTEDGLQLIEDSQGFVIVTPDGDRRAFRRQR